MEFSAQQIASVLGGTVEGDPEVKVNNFSKIEEGKPGTLTFLANPKYEHFIYQTEASIVLVNNDFTPAEPVKATLVKVANAYASLAILLNMAEQANVKKAGIDATAFGNGRRRMLCRQLRLHRRRREDRQEQPHLSARLYRRPCDHWR